MKPPVRKSWQRATTQNRICLRSGLLQYEQYPKVPADDKASTAEKFMQGVLFFEKLNFLTEKHTYMSYICVLKSIKDSIDIE
jgi:hypothetical protein